MQNEVTRILVVDDTASNIQVLVQILRSEGDFSISVANNGLQALEQMEKVKPDLVLLDIIMPELDGYETCKRMKQDEDLSDIPVIFLSAKIEADDQVKAFDVGGVDYVTKPFNSIELMARVRTHLDLKKSHDEIRNQVILLSQARSELELKLAVMEADLQSAEVVQQTLLPHSAPIHDDYKIAFRYRPMEVVGGDYICFPPLLKNKQGFFIGDLTGHGVSAALYMSLLKFITDTLFTSYSCDPQELLTKLNSQLFGKLSCSFITAIYGVLTLDEKGESYHCLLAGAGHTKPILYDHQKRSHSYQNLPNGPAIGILPEFGATNYALQLHKGSRLYLYTDGLTESENCNSEELGNDRFLEIVEAGYDLCLEKTLENILRSVDDFRGGQASTDDVTILVFEINQGSEAL